MKTELQKMLDGELYQAWDEELTNMRNAARVLLHKYNQLMAAPMEEKKIVIKQLLGKCSTVDIQPPFYCDYGAHIIVGENLFMNFNCVVLDCALVRAECSNIYRLPSTRCRRTH
jgi:maltose O-acetyltransferase